VTRESDRSRNYSTEGVVLRRRNFGEGDSILTVLSAGRGKFQAVARGIRKPRSRMRGHLEPLTRSRMLLARGRNLDVFTQAETLDAYRTIREDLERTATALYCAELADRFLGEGQEQPGLYELFVGVLEALDTGAPLHLARYYELELLALSGYEIQLDRCASCGATLPEEPALISAAAGGLACTACRPLAGQGRIVSVRAMKVLRYARRASLGDFLALRVEPELAAELDLAVSEVVRDILESEPLTGRYLEQVARLPRANPVGRTPVQ
jgi:DNA repair protein RecO (recombination protein O)